jgi:hypothetical protein
MVIMMMKINCNALLWLFIDIAVKRSKTTIFDTHGHECMYVCVCMSWLPFFINTDNGGSELNGCLPVNRIN